MSPSGGASAGLARDFSLIPACSRYEQEAERVASEVMRMPDPVLDSLRTPVSAPRMGEVGFLRGGGEPLTSPDRTFLEPRFRHDFSHVRLHTDATATRAAASIHARAFTLGNNVVFGEGQYHPATPQTRRLLAHELTHVVQQAREGDRRVVMRTPEDEGAASPAQTRDERVVSRGDVELYADPNDDILGVEPVAVLSRGTRFAVLDESDPTVTHIEVLDGPARGRTGYISALREHHLRPEEYGLLETMLDFDRGWHQALPTSNLPAGSIGYEAAEGRGEQPRLGGRYPETPQLEPMADASAAEARQLVISYVRDQLSRVRIPTTTGRLATRHGGYAYRSQSYETETSQGHQEFLDQATLQDIGLDAGDRRVAALWGEFNRIVGQEGDTSAINAYDDQIVTLGGGFSASSGDAGAIYNRMPAATRQRLYEQGIRVNPDNTFTVLDLDRGVVETGENALRLLQVNPRMLGALIQAAQSEEEMTQGGETRSARSWMLRAQFERFMERNRDVPDAVLTAWPADARRFAFKLKHWSGALGWEAMGRTGGDVSELANYALRRVTSVRSDWTPAWVRRKILGIAGRSGVSAGRITFEGE